MIRRAPAAFRVALLLVALSARAGAQSRMSGPTLQIARASSAIAIDGDLSDDAWRTAPRVETWYESQPGDNTAPRVRNVGYLAYDDQAFYAAFEFEDPRPLEIRAPFADRDNIGNGLDDYAGVLLDPANSGRQGYLFVVSPRNVQYRLVDRRRRQRRLGAGFLLGVGDEDQRPGLDARDQDPVLVPASAWWALLRVHRERTGRPRAPAVRQPPRAGAVPQRERGGASTRRPRLAARPGSARRTGGPRSEVHAERRKRRGRQISANERFALFFPEKRPFFLEGVDLFQTLIQAVYTRTITAPNWGGRSTGQAAGTRYTALVADDAGGGSTIIPGPDSSALASQAFGATVVVGRAKRDVGLSFVGALYADRENRDGNGHNRVTGPDFLWRVASSDTLSGQWLYSATRLPNQTDLAAEWNGQAMTGRAAQVAWNRATTHFDATVEYKDITDGFRADSGFVPQVGYRALDGNTGWTTHPGGFLSALRTFVDGSRQTDQHGGDLVRNTGAGVFFQSRWNGVVLLRYSDDRTRAGDGLLSRRQLTTTAEYSPSRLVKKISLNGTFGEEIDFENARPRQAFVKVSYAFQR